mmetsp:Transcript_13793/g.32085  ORF Transcript_13793/g.32085 Transcript_13793/m.32085 type:complete len:290 (-) Transcript_13793:48-917(-)
MLSTSGTNFRHLLVPRHIPVGRRSCRRFLSINTDTGTRENQTTKKPNRREVMAQRRAAKLAYLDALHSEKKSMQVTTATTTTDSAERPDETDRSMWREGERAALLEEAAFITRALFRTCLRSVEIIRPGNEHDEEEFRRREEESKRTEESPGSIESLSMSPPVDRENELSSRANYYYMWTRENFEQESDCLESNPWREHDIEKFLHLVKSGEESRKWILKDYKFPDDYEGRFDQDRLDRFEERAKAFIEDTYRAMGWSLASDLEKEGAGMQDDDDDDFFDDEPFDPTKT